MCNCATGAARERVHFHIAVVETFVGERRSRVLCGADRPEFLVNSKYVASLPEGDFCPKCKAEMERLNAASV